MTPAINILSPDVVCKIAAGEVIERPASVLKELIENSLDANSSTIRVTIEGGGRNHIVVSDDGHGMNREDALKALQRHATSKLANEEDLYRITTLGFRGEALPSIAAISRLTLTTRSHDASTGIRVRVEGGHIVETVETGAPYGTRVEVDDLFYNLPARRKFLKGEKTEAAHVIETVVRMALDRYAVAFRLIHDGRSLFDLPPTDQELARIRAVMGKEVASHLVPVNYRKADYGISGWVSRPTLRKGSAKGLYTYVNGRYVRDKTLSHAVSAAYQGLIPPKTYPVAILAVVIPLDELDVNVHPTKLEIRFKNSSEVHGMVTHGLMHALRTGPVDGPSQPEQPTVREKEPSYHAAVTTVMPTLTEECWPWRTVGQLMNSYLVVEFTEGVVVLDQHAVHERVLYEQLRGRGPARLPQQRLLIPQLCDMTGDVVALLLEHRSEMETMGLELEEFGARTVAVTAVPAVLHDEDITSLLESLARQITLIGKADSVGDVVHTIATMVACRGAIKAGRRLHDTEVRALLQQWDALGRPTTCPHGRPLIKELSWGEIERWFNRS